MGNQSGINYFFESYTNLDPQTFKIFYNFQQTGSGAAIPSVSLGDGLYSGTINNYTPSFWSYSGSGFFTGGQYITINNSSNNLFSGSNLSFITVAQKSNTNNNILFSCADTGFVGPSFAYRGFTFGLNAANKLYFEYYGPSGLEIFTLPNILAEKNSLSVVLGEDTVTLGQYDFFNQQLNSETFGIDSDFIFAGSVWKVGSNQGAPSFDASCGFTGWLDTFMVFNTAISESDISFLNSGYLASVDVEPQISGYVSVTQVTGTTTGITGFYTAVTGFSVVSTGIIQDEFGNSYTGIIPAVPLTGTVNATGIIFLTGVVNTAIITGLETVVTFNENQRQTFGYDFSNALFYVNLDDINEGYFYTGTLNTLSGIDFLIDSAYNKIKNTFNSNYTGDIAFYANGVFLSSGSSNFNGNLYDPINTLQYDYILTGFNVNTTGFLDFLDSSLYDVFINQQVVFTGKSYPSGGGNVLITGISGTQSFFFNGQRLSSGVNYIASGNSYYVSNSGLFDGATGNLSTIYLPNYLNYVRRVSPVLNSNNKFIPGASLVYLNGVRQYLGTTESYIEAGNTSLLSGSGNFNTYLSIPLYQNSDLFFS